MSKQKNANNVDEGQSRSTVGLEHDPFTIADQVIETAYPNIYGLEKGYWGHQRVQNWGILRHAIAEAIFKDRIRERSNKKLRGCGAPKADETTGG